MAQKLLRPAVRYLSCVRQSAPGVVHSSFPISIHIQRSCSLQRQLLWQPLCSALNFKDINGKKYSTKSVEPPRPWTDVSITQLMSGIKSKTLQLFDVRTTEEVIETGMMPGATNIPLSEFAGAFELSPEAFKARYGADMPRKSDTNIVLHCLGGIRSLNALQSLHAAGYTLARHYPGGWEVYEEIVNNNDLNSLRPYTDINYEELMSMIQSKDIQLFDVRHVEEVEQTGMIPAATNLPLENLEEALMLSANEFQEKYGVDMPSKDDENVVVHCHRGCRSTKALVVLWEAGYHKARHYPGGWSEYIARKDN